MAIYKQQTRFVPRSFEELSRLPLAEAERDASAYKLATQLKDLELEAFNEADNPYIESQRQPILSAVEGVTKGLIGGQKVSSEQISALAKASGDYRNFQDFAKRYIEEGAATRGSVMEGMARADGWGEMADAEKQRVLSSRGLINPDGTIKGERFDLPDWFEHRENATDYIDKHAGTTTTIDGWGGRKFFSKADLNKKGTPAQVEKALSELQDPNAYVVWDSEGNRVTETNVPQNAALAEAWKNDVLKNKDRVAYFKKRLGTNSDSEVKAYLDLELKDVLAGLATTKESNVNKSSFNISTEGNEGVEQSSSDGQVKTYTNFKNTTPEEGKKEIDSKVNQLKQNTTQAVPMSNADATSTGLTRGPGVSFDYTKHPDRVAFEEKYSNFMKAAKKYVGIAQYGNTEDYEEAIYQKAVDLWGAASKNMYVNEYTTYSPVVGENNKDFVSSLESFPILDVTGKPLKKSVRQELSKDTNKDKAYQYRIDFTEGVMQLKSGDDTEYTIDGLGSGSDSNMRNYFRDGLVVSKLFTQLDDETSIASEAGSKKDKININGKPVEYIKLEDPTALAGSKTNLVGFRRADADADMFINGMPQVLAVFKEGNNTLERPLNEAEYKAMMENLTKSVGKNSTYYNKQIVFK